MNENPIDDESNEFIRLMNAVGISDADINQSSYNRSLDQLSRKYTELISSGNFTIETGSTTLVHILPSVKERESFARMDKLLGKKEPTVLQGLKYIVDESSKVALQIVGNGTITSPFKINDKTNDYLKMSLVKLVKKYSNYMREETYFEIIGDFTYPNQTRKYMCDEEGDLEIVKY